MNFLPLFIILLSFLIISCKTSNNNEIDFNKMDAQSKINLLNEEAKDNPEDMDLVILLSTNLNDELRASIEDKNVKIFAVTGNILTAIAKPAAIREILKLNFIKSIEINKKSFN